MPIHIDPIKGHGAYAGHHSGAELKHVGKRGQPSCNARLRKWNRELIDARHMDSDRRCSNCGAGNAS